MVTGKNLCFCDRGAFSVADCRRVLAAGRQQGLIPRLHAEQLTRTGASRLAVEFEAASADHLDKLSSAVSAATINAAYGCVARTASAPLNPASKPTLL